jgi:DeoR/GlpR family transcriptional regulator of sugar metabolism
MAIQRQLILDGAVSVEALSRKLDASVATIRRDLSAMEEDGLIRRTHGGAVIHAPRGADQAFALREQADSEAKRAIAQRALQLIEPDQTVLMNDGSTMLALALEIVASTMPLTVVTPGVNVATRLAERSTITSYLLGGRVRHLTLATSGSFAESMLASFNADTAFIAAEGLSTRRGLSFSYETDAELARLMAAHADRTVVLATARKLQQSDRITALPLSAINTLVTDCTDEAILAAFAGSGIEVLRAPLPTPVAAAG